MRLGASTSDWHTNNPRLRPGLWILALLAGAAVIFLLVGTVGRFVDGDGRPTLNQVSSRSYPFPEHRWPT
jgi:hypothetical protein